MTFELEMEDYWEDRWRPIGAAVAVEADSPSAALALITSTGLRPGVTYRIHIYGPDGGDHYSEPAQTPDLPVLARSSHTD